MKPERDIFFSEIEPEETSSKKKTSRAKKVKPEPQTEPEPKPGAKRRSIGLPYEEHEGLGLNASARAREAVQNHYMTRSRERLFQDVGQFRETLNAVEEETQRDSNEYIKQRIFSIINGSDESGGIVSVVGMDSKEVVVDVLQGVDSWQLMGCLNLRSSESIAGQILSIMLKYVIDNSSSTFLYHRQGHYAFTELDYKYLASKIALVADKAMSRGYEFDSAYQTLQRTANRMSAPGEIKELWKELWGRIVAAGRFSNARGKKFVIVLEIEHSDSNSNVFGELEGILDDHVVVITTSMVNREYNDLSISNSWGSWSSSDFYGHYCMGRVFYTESANSSRRKFDVFNSDFDDDDDF